MLTELGERMVNATKKIERKKEFEMAFKSELRQLRAWQSDMQKFIRMPDDEYKFKQLNNAISAIYSLYVRMNRLSQNYKPSND